MQLLTYRTGTQTRLGVVDGDQVIDLNQAQPQVPHDLLVALAAGVDVLAAAKAALASDAPRIPRAGLKIAAPVPRPGK